MCEKNYPSAALLQSVCADDYKRLIETYDRIYDKVNIALAFSGAVLLVILSAFDYTIVKDICKATNKELFTILVQIVFTLVSAVCIIWAVIQLLILLRSKPLPFVDSIAIRDEELYRESSEDVSVWLIDKYTIAINSLKKVNADKQKKFDSAVTKVIVSIIAYAIVIVIQKGV